MRHEADRWEKMCHRCMGEGCSRCAEEGWQKVSGKPREFLEGDAGLHLFAAYRWLKEYGIFPAEGGLLRQSSRFIQAVEFCDMVAGRYMRRKEEVREQADELNKRFASLGGKR